MNAVVKCKWHVNGFTVFSSILSNNVYLDMIAVLCLGLVVQYVRSLSQSMYNNMCLLIFVDTR